MGNTKKKNKKRTADIGQKSNHGKKARERKVANDLLLPILIVLTVLPFVIYFKVYQSDISRFAWAGIDEKVMDFYTYYKSRIFVLIAAACVVVLLFRLPLYPEKRKPLRLFALLALYAVLVLLSTCFSIDPKMSLFGAPYMYENVWVLLSYAVICFYTYQIVDGESDYKRLHKAICILLAGFFLFGALQLFGKDPVNMTWFQRIVMNQADEVTYLGTFEDVFTRNYVYLTTMNPNYAGHLLAMLLAYVFAFFCSETEKKKKWAYGAVAIFLFVLLWFTYSRGALVAMVFGMAAVFWAGKRPRGKKALGIAAAAALALICLALLLDACTGFHFLGRMQDEKEKLRLSKITTGENVTIVYDGKTQVIDDLSEEEFKTVTLDGRDWVFTKKDGTYYYVNEFGKYDQIPEIEAVDFGGYEYLGSGRLYIWSRSLPLVKKYFLLGSGPDTFIEAYPQNDYVGKANYSHSVTMYIEKAHNGYLMCLVQTGFFAFAALIVFFGAVWMKAGKNLSHFYGRANGKVAGKAKGTAYGIPKESAPLVMRMQLAFYGMLAAYMAGLLFCDSTIFTTPFACVGLGILAIDALSKQGIKD